MPSKEMAIRMQSFGQNLARYYHSTGQKIPVETLKARLDVCFNCPSEQFNGRRCLACHGCQNSGRANNNLNAALCTPEGECFNKVKHWGPYKEPRIFEVGIGQVSQNHQSMSSGPGVTI